MVALAGIGLYFGLKMALVSGVSRMIDDYYTAGLGIGHKFGIRSR
jgi:hypothetical protein